ncbi:hypothetical protein YC2023_079151 [Brassica napus]
MGRGPGIDSYPKSQNTKVEDPQSSRSNEPVLTSVHPYRNTSEHKWIFKRDPMKALDTHHNRSHST